jgi:transposase InsO family protein
LAEGIADLFEYIEPLYNRRRRHSPLGGKSPERFLENWISAQHAQKLAA